MKFVLTIVACVILATFPENSEATLLMKTHGYITVAPYIHGFDRSEGLYPGYRSEFMTYVDFYENRGLVLNSLLGTTTMITDPDGHGLKMDRIRYTLTPGFRYEFDTWLVKGALHHECIHVIGRPEIDGSTWWNSFQIGVGTKGSYYLYLRDEYRNKRDTFVNSWDVQINAGYIAPAKRTLFSGQNHDYRAEIFSRIRYHIGSYGNWVYFSGLAQNTWFKKDGSAEHQITITLNAFRRGLANFAGFFYTYSLYDTFTLDNSDGLGSVGFRIVF